MKRHSSVYGGYIAFNSSITWAKITRETSNKLEFTAIGSGAYKIIVKVPKNASNILKDGKKQTDWTYEPEQELIKISTPSLSTWTLIFAENQDTFLKEICLYLIKFVSLTFATSEL